jgi:hypothetical protein
MSVISTDLNVVSSDVCVVPSNESDDAEILKAFHTFFKDGEWCEVRVMDAEMKDGSTAIVNGFFNDPAAFVQEVGCFPAGSVTFCINPICDDVPTDENKNTIVRTKTGGSVSNHQVLMRRYLVLDFDPIRAVKGTCATNEEKQHAIDLSEVVVDRLRREFSFSEPMIIDSGNGRHVYWEINQPNNEATKKIIKDFIQLLSAVYSTALVTVDTATSKIAQPMRIPGTYNRKSVHTDERPNRMCRFVEIPETKEILTLDKIQNVIKVLAEENPPDVNESGGVTAKAKTNPGRSVQIDADFPDEVKAILKVLGTGATVHSHDGGITYCLDVCPYCGWKRRGKIFLADSGARTISCFRESCPSNKTNFWEFLKQIGLQEKDLQWEPMPLDFFPEMLQTYITTTATSLSVDPSIVALSVLAACSGAIGPTYQIVVHESFARPAGIWTLAVVPSGGGKSPCVNIPAAACLRKEVNYCAEYKQAMEEYRRQEKDRKKGDPHPEKPTLKHATIQNFTIEALKCALANSPRGLTVIGSEGQTVLMAFGEYKQGREGPDRAFVNQVWSHEWSSTIRKTNDEVTMCTFPYMAMSLAVQPKYFNQVMPKEAFNSGFAYRFLMSMPPRLRRNPNAPGVTPILQAKMDGLINRLYMIRQDFEEGDKPTDAYLSEDGKKIRAAYINENEDRIEDEPHMSDRVMESMAKFEEYSIRLALWHHIVSAILTGKEPSQTVDAESMGKGVQLAKWCQREAERIYRTCGWRGDETAETELAASLHAYLKQNPKATASTLQKNHKSRLKNADDVRKFVACFPTMFRVAEDGSITAIG